MRVPGSTYRIQFRPEFGFRDAAAIVDYLDRLGVTHLYASPIFAARVSSTHGYDVVDPNVLNPALGSGVEYRALVDAVHGLGLGWMQDIVPNHMAFDTANRMLMDVFEHGEASAFCNYFDIAWNHPYESLRGRVLAPHLGRFYGECLERGEIRLAYEAGTLSVRYFDLAYPLRIETYAVVFAHDAKRLEAALGGDHPDLRKFRDVTELLRSGLPATAGRARAEQVSYCKETIRDLYASGGEVRAFIDGNLELFNGRSGDAASFALLDDLLALQHFRLSFWKVAAEEINYRRFFNVNGLISMKVEREEVFRETHRLILKSAWQGDFDAVRIDHIDGLYDPAAYLQRLRDAAPGTFVVVEKILERSEPLPAGWPVAGTTGYDFLTAVTTLLCDPAGERGLDGAYAEFSGDPAGYAELVAGKKRLIIGRHMAGDVDALAHLLKEIASRDRHARDITLYGLRRALVELLALFPVYRTYVTAGGPGGQDREIIRDTASRARATSPALVLELDFIERFLLLDLPADITPEERAGRLRFAMRFQQLTGPLMAKGFEDTTLYIYNRLLSLNDVGGTPDRMGMPPAEFHEFIARRASLWPHTMNSTSTHDTKRGEDVRARLSVLSELPGEWRARVTRWRELNRRHKTIASGREIPDPNDEYFLYQTLVGAYPFDPAELPAFPGRIREYMIKAVREAKTHTAWLKPDDTYENCTTDFVERILDDANGNPFLDDFLPFQRKVAHHGMLNSLSQLLLKCACPGIPDVYQGAELWDLNLVDPDNRRPVDFDRRKAYLGELQGIPEEQLGKQLWEMLRSYVDGRVKMFTVAALLAARRETGPLFLDGSYVPLGVRGRHAGRVVAFARRLNDSWAVAMAPIRTVGIVPEGGFPVGVAAWGDTAVELPGDHPAKWSNVFTGEEVAASGGVLLLAEVCSVFPVGLLVPVGG